MNYNDILSQLRELARDELRLRAINVLRSDKLEIEILKTKTEHSLEIENYELANLDKDYPDYEKMKAEKDDTIAVLGRQLDIIKRDLENTDNEIVKVVSGETKISKDDLQCLTDKLIARFIREKITELE